MELYEEKKETKKAKRALEYLIKNDFPNSIKFKAAKINFQLSVKLKDDIEKKVYFFKFNILK